MTDKAINKNIAINELLEYINKTNNFKSVKKGFIIQVFNNNKHLLYINTRKIKQILYTKYGKENDRVSVLFNDNKILTIYYNKGQYIFNV